MNKVGSRLEGERQLSAGIKKSSAACLAVGVKKHNSQKVCVAISIKDQTRRVLHTHVPVYPQSS